MLQLAFLFLAPPILPCRWCFFSVDTFCRSRIDLSKLNIVELNLLGRSPFDLQPFFCKGISSLKIQKLVYQNSLKIQGTKHHRHHPCLWLFWFARLRWFSAWLPFPCPIPLDCLLLHQTWTCLRLANGIEWKRQKSSWSLMKLWMKIMYIELESKCCLKISTHSRFQLNGDGTMTIQV